MKAEKITFKKFLKDCLTGKDNETFELIRVVTVGSLMVFWSLSTIDVIYTHDFEYQQFGIGNASILAAAGLGIKFKRKTDRED